MAVVNPRRAQPDGTTPAPTRLQSSLLLRRLGGDELELPAPAELACRVLCVYIYIYIYILWSIVDLRIFMSEGLTQAGSQFQRVEILGP